MSKYACPDCGEELKVIRETSFYVNKETGEKKNKALIEDFAECYNCGWKENTFMYPENEEEYISNWDYKEFLEGV